MSGIQFFAKVKLGSDGEEHSRSFRASRTPEGKIEIQAQCADFEKRIHDILIELDDAAAEKLATTLLDYAWKGKRVDALQVLQAAKPHEANPDNRHKWTK